ncbi:protein phosphatase 2C domain-containing protein [bacterium]|nr:protein phosphatase 2C domain-containing protein [bacterium]
MQRRKSKKPIFNAFGISDIGVNPKRTKNEDSFKINTSIGLFIVADGVGGYAGGKIASDLVVRKMDVFLSNVLKALDEDRDESVQDLEHFPELSEEDLFKRSIASANRAVYDENIRLKSELESEVLKSNKFKRKGNMGTTLVAGLARNNKIYVVNIGDSRLYRLRDGMLQQLTVDQSILEEKLQSGEITEDEAKTEKRNRITQCVGTRKTVNIEVDRLTTRVGDRYIMCTDGLTDGFLDEELFRTATETMKQENLKQICSELIELAKRGGSRDNITVVIFDIVDLGIKPPGQQWKEDGLDDEETLMPGWD